MKFYFASTINFDGKILVPEIPKNKMGKENDFQKRICVSQSINGCLTAIGGFDFGDTVYIHECESEFGYQPDLDEVPDRFLTGETWIFDNTKMNLFMTVKIIGMIDSHVDKMNNTLYCFTVVE